MKLLNRIFFLLDIKLFFHVYNSKSSIHFHNKSFFFFPIQKSLGSKVDDMTYASKPPFFFDQVLSNFAKNNFNIGVITTCIIKNKVFKFLIKIILLNNLNNLLRNNLTKIIAKNSTQANKYCLEFYAVINIVSYNSNKSNRVAQGPYIEQKVNSALGLTHLFRQ